MPAAPCHRRTAHHYHHPANKDFDHWRPRAALLEVGRIIKWAVAAS
jgi:hypothetical protein